MSFALYLDENIDVRLAAHLRANGHDVLSTMEAALANKRTSDEEQLKFAAGEGRAILTYNVRDFVGLARAWSDEGREHAGIILSERRSPEEMLARLETLFEDHPEGLTNLCLWLPRPR